MIKNSCIALVLAALAACDRGDSPAGYQGVVELEERVLGFEVPGRVITLTAERGDPIAAAQVIATLDDDQPRASVAVRTAEAEAATQNAKLVARGGRAEEIRAVEAKLRAARATEAIAVKRYADDAKLLARGVIVRTVADESEAKRASAIAERESLEQQLLELRTGARREEIASAEAQATAAGAAVALETDRAALYQLRSLHDGEVLDVHVEAGEVVAAGTPVVTIGDTTHPYVEVFVPQRDLANIRTGVRAAVRVDALPQVFPGVVEHVARRMEFTPRFIFSTQERANLVVRVRVRIADPARALHAGTPAFVTIGA